MEKNNKLGLIPLVFLIIGSMIGAGVFGLPADMASGASAGAMILAWIITGVSMICLAFVYNNLALRKPELDGGVYSYARAGFGDYVGFNSAWGYWVSAICCNISYYVVIFNGLGYFFPTFAGDGNIYALIGGSIVIWAAMALIASGVKQATIVNIFVQIMKLIPILLFIILVIVAFKAPQFTTDFFGKGNPDLGSIGAQMKNTMLVTLWVFIGIEGAVVVSARAKNRKDVGRATVMGLLGALAVYILVSVLTFGYMSQQDIAALETPSMAYAMQAMVGDWGAALINIAMILSVTGALLGWNILAMEILYVSSKDKMMPKWFSRENKVGEPINAIFATMLFQQVLLILSYFVEASYQFAYSVSTTAILIPYLLSGAYGWKLAATGETYDKNPAGRTKDLVMGIIATIYAVWLIYAAGLNYTLLVTILYAVGFIPWYMVQKENKRKLFNNTTEVTICAVLTIAAVIAIVMMIMGKLSY